MNAFLLPFLNVFILYISLNKGHILFKPYTWFTENITPKLPIPHSILGGCVLCTSFWMGLFEMMAIRNDWTGVLLLAYNAVVTNILYKLLKYEIN